MFLGAADVPKSQRKGAHAIERPADLSLGRKMSLMLRRSVYGRGRGWYERQVIGGAVLDVFPLRIGRLLEREAHV